MNAAITSNTPATKPTTPVIKDDEYVTDEVTMSDGSKAYLKHKKISTVISVPIKPKSNVIVDQVSRFKNFSCFNDHCAAYVYPMVVNGTSCIVATAGGGEGSSITITCDWNKK